MSYVKDVSEILEKMLNEVSSEYAKSKGTWLWEILKACALGLSEVSEDVEEVSGKFYYEDLYGDELDDYVENWSHTTRKKAALASGEVTFVFSAGKTGEIPAGTVVSAGTVTFSTTESGTVETAGGSVTLAVECNTYGEIGNVEAGAVTTLVTGLGNIESVYNEYAMTGGSDRESDEDLKARFAKAMKKAANAGNKAFNVELAESVDGVGAAYCIACPGDVAGTAEIYIINSDGGQAAESVIEAVQAVVDPNLNGDGSGEAPIGAIVTVKTPEILDVEVTAELILEDGYSVSAVQEEAEENVSGYLTESFSAGIARYNRIGECLLDTEGILDYRNLTVNGGTADLEGETYGNGERVPLIFRLSELNLS